MMNKSIAVISCLLFLALPVTLNAEVIKFGQNDTIKSVLTAQKGNRVSVKLNSGSELTGIIRTINSNVVHLGALSGKEYYDALINIGSIEAVVIRVK